MRRITLTLTLMFSAGIGQAQDAALILGNDQYVNFDRVPRAADVTAARDELTGLGFVVDAIRNGGSDQVDEALGRFAARSAGADRMIVALSGHFVTDGQRTWLLNSDSADPTLFDVGDDGVSLDALLTVLGQHPGGAVLALGFEENPDPASPFLRGGVGALDIPQGVTLVQSGPREIGIFLQNHLAQPSADLGLAISDAGIEAHGFAPQSWVFMPAAEDVILTTGDVTIDPGVEAAAWESAQSADSADGYRAFLSQFPSGAFAEEAQSRLDAILAEPFRDQRLAEESLSLTRNQRRDIQRDLTILDYDTRGIDGIFGSGTRRALTNWQQVNGYPQTSYLTEEQINRLDAQAARRQAQLEAEAEARRAEAERLDRAYWDETGARGDETGYRTYLERHPDGVYSQLARDALAEIEAAKLATSEAAERDAWNRASNADIILAYRQYLTDFPQGQFVDQALTRIEEISADAAEADQNIEAENAENALNLNSLTLRLIEGRLAELGLDPGEVDGQIDDDTRRAIRVYQRDRDLEVTGYLSEAVLVRLLADSL